MVRMLVHCIWKLLIRLQPSRRLPVMVWMHAHQIWKLRVEVQPSRRSFLMVRTCEACYGNYLQQTCIFPDDRVIPSRRCSYTGKISPRKFQKILLHSCLFGRPWFTIRTALRQILPNAHFDLQTINKGPWALRAARIRY